MNKKVQARVEQMDNIPPRSNPFHYDMCRMGTQVGDSLVVMYSSHEIKEREVVLVDTITGVRIKVVLPPATWEQLGKTIELDCYETSRRFDYNEQVNSMEKCPYCGRKHTMGYIGIKRVRYHWKNMPKEIHLALCGACNAIHFIKIEA